MTCESNGLSVEDTTWGFHSFILNLALYIIINRACPRSVSIETLKSALYSYCDIVKFILVTCHRRCYGPSSKRFYILSAVTQCDICFVSKETLGRVAKLWRGLRWGHTKRISKEGLPRWSICQCDIIDTVKVIFNKQARSTEPLPSPSSNRNERGQNLWRWIPYNQYIPLPSLNQTSAVC